jgi:hypothetical protein
MKPGPRRRTSGRRGRTSGPRGRTAGPRGSTRVVWDMMPVPHRSARLPRRSRRFGRVSARGPLRTRRAPRNAKHAVRRTKRTHRRSMAPVRVRTAAPSKIVAVIRRPRRLVPNGPCVVPIGPRLVPNRRGVLWRRPRLLPGAMVGPSGLRAFASARCHLIRFTRRMDTCPEHPAPDITVPKTVTTDGDLRDGSSSSRLPRAMLQIPCVNSSASIRYRIFATSCPLGVPRPVQAFHGDPDG